MCAALAIAALPSEAAYAGASGLDWNEPRSYFEGVDRFGNVNYVEKIGDIDLQGDKPVSWPLLIKFNSSWAESSPYLGKGWMLPLLESRIAQIDDKTFKMWRPDGFQTIMRRDRAYPQLLHSPKWEAAINGDTITVWTVSGWKLLYKNGKIALIDTPSGDVLTYDYQDGRVAALKEGSTVLLSVDFDDKTGEARGLETGNKSIKFDQGDKPRVQCINGQNILGGMDASLSKITYPDGSSEIYKFAVNEHVQPTLQIGNRLIVWDPLTGHIIKDGDWVYSVTPSNGPLANAEIKRTNSNNKSESWLRDKKDGLRSIQTLDGTTKVSNWFTSGPLRGKHRSVTLSGNGLNQTTKYDYAPNGVLLRKTTGDSETSYTYNANGSKSTEVLSKGDKVLQVIYYNEKGILVALEDRQ